MRQFSTAKLTEEMNKEERKHVVRLVEKIHAEPERKNLSKIFSVTTISLSRFSRLARIAWLVDDRIRLNAFEALLRRLLGFLDRIKVFFTIHAMNFRGATDHRKDLLNFLITYGTCQSTNFATERPLVALTPLSLEEEEEIEDEIGKVVQFLNRSKVITDRNQEEIFARLLRIIEAQSLFLVEGTDRHLYAVQNAASEEALITCMKKCFNPEKRQPSERFEKWFRNACREFEDTSAVNTLGGKTGRRVAVAYHFLRGVNHQLERRPIYEIPDDLESHMRRVSEAYSQFYEKLCAYLGSLDDRSKAVFLEHIGRFLDEVHRVCGNYRKMSRREKYNRLSKLFKKKSREAFAESQFWWEFATQNAPLSQIEESQPIAPPVFNACVQAEALKAEPERQVWNVMALLNCEIDIVLKFVAASACLHPPAHYDRIFSIGNSGIVPGVLLSVAFRKRLSIGILRPFLDFFPLPSHLEKLMIVDDSLQTSFTIHLMLESLQRLGYAVEDSDVMVVLKLNGGGESRSPSAVGGLSKHWMFDRREVRSIVDYKYKNEEDCKEVISLRDESALVTKRMTDVVRKRIRDSIRRIRDRVGRSGCSTQDQIRNIVAYGRSEVFHKPWLLFNHPDDLLWISDYLVQRVENMKLDAVIASSFLDVPLLAIMSLIHRIEFSDQKRESGNGSARDRSIQFLFYDSEKALLMGIGPGAGKMQGWRCAVLDCTIKTGETLGRIKSILNGRGAEVAAFACFVSRFVVSDIESEIAKVSLIPEECIGGPKDLTFSNRSTPTSGYG